MKFSNTKALTTRLLVALTLAVASVAGLSGIAEAATCLTCHAPVGSSTDIRPAESTWRNITTGSIVGSHSKHMAVTMSQNACVPCHTGVSGYSTNHSNNLIDVQAGGYSRGVQFAQSGNPVLGTCASASCHVTSYNTSYVTSPTWGVTSGCVGCHTGVGAFTGTGSAPKTGAHTKHMAIANASCGQCHAGAVTATSGGNAHADHNIDVQGSAITGYTANITKHAVGTYVGNCTTTCHASAYSTTTGNSPTWGVTNGGCALCHNAAGSFTGTGSSPNTGKHTKHMAVSGTTCASCHAGAVAGTTGGSAHFDLNIDVQGTSITGYTANVTKHAVGSAYLGTCLTSCHATPYTTAGTSPSWGAANPGCVSCHSGAGAFTGAGTSPNTGNHTKHMAITSPVVTCGSCHAGAIAGSSGGTAHADGNVDVQGTAITGYTANVTKHTAGSGYSSTCATSCHSVYSPSAGTSPTWGLTALGCASCHNGVGAFTGLGTSPATGRHTQHFSVDLAMASTCASCHTGAAAGTTGGSNHLDGNVDVVGSAVTGYTANVTKHAAGTYTGTCNVSCHGKTLASNTSTGYPNTPSGNLTLPAWNTPFLTGAASVAGNGTSTWGTGDCAKCHGFPPMTSTHAGQGATACKGCHPNVSAAGTSFDTPATHVDGTVQSTSGCTSCHKQTQVARMNVMLQFTTASNSHHYQSGTAIDNKVCYACHWEADSTGSTTGYHGKSGTSVVDLVVWSTTGVRPTTWSTTGTATAVVYLSGGALQSSRTEIAKINNHCLGCHNDANKNITPFGPNDTNTPSTYSWEKKVTTAGGFGAAQSIGAKYSATTTTAWGKFTGNFTNNKNQVKAYSAHNNTQNQRGWSTLIENLQSTTAVANYPNTSGSVAVLCFDCHNSHGTSVAPTTITSSYDSVGGGVKKGGILKQTIASQGGYSVTYTPGSAGSVAEKNVYNAGAGLCFDCHNNSAVGSATLSGSSTPWGYTATFGASQIIHGYNDTPYFGKSGGIFAKTRTYGFTSLTSTIQGRSMGSNAGGHFGRSGTALETTPDAAHQIGGLCTPCHDPHGVSPGLAANQANAVPLLKGTFVTSPYKVDVPAPTIGNQVRSGGSKAPVISIGSEPGYHIDQNTLQAARNTTKSSIPVVGWTFATSATTLQNLNSTQFAGLCINCHTQASLQNTTAPTTANWKTNKRIHNSVAGWAVAGGGNVGNKVHAFTCSKCHTTHNSRLPRLLVTNCLDVKHRGRVLSSPFIATTYAAWGVARTSVQSIGRFPSGGGGLTGASSATNPGPWYFGTTASATVVPTLPACHETATAGGTTSTNNGTSQHWNTKSLW